MKGTLWVNARKMHELRNRTLFTVLVLAIYMLCRNVPLSGVASDGVAAGGADSLHFLTTLVSGDRYRMTVMALGIAPYINASLVVQIITAFRSASSRARVSKIRSDRQMIVVAVVFSIVMAILQSFELTYQADTAPSWAVRLVVIVEMFAGAMLITFLCLQNEKHGVGASMPVILLNILTSLVHSLDVYHFVSYPALAAVCLVAVAGTLLMENSTIRIPLQRVSIHNVHADQNYLAYKRAPMGIMPVMFAASAFLLPYYLVRMLSYYFPDSASLSYLSDNMALTRPLGAVVYLALILVLAVLFSLLMLNPKETAHQLQRNGDSVIGMYAGKPTARYLTGIVLRWSLASGVLQAACMAIPLALSLNGAIPSALALVPASVMILVSIVCSLAREISTYYRYDSYRFFI
ncbi:MAG: hypothetical protein SOI24_09085 [Coriobacteriales bacterium]|jgi:preprotein translocase subunit SecY